MTALTGRTYDCTVRRRFTLKNLANRAVPHMSQSPFYTKMRGPDSTVIDTPEWPLRKTCALKFLNIYQAVSTKHCHRRLHFIDKHCQYIASASFVGSCKPP